jgi:hypothetical protein
VLAAQDLDLLSERARRILHVVQLRLEGRLSRIEKHGDQRTGRDDLAQQPEPLCSEHLDQGGDPGDITAGPVVARHQADLHRVLAAREDDGDCCRGGLGRQRGRRAAGADHRDPGTHKIVRQRRQSIVLTLRPKVLDADISVLDIAGFIQAAAEGGNEMSARRG